VRTGLTTGAATASWIGSSRPEMYSEPATPQTAAASSSLPTQTHCEDRVHLRRHGRRLREVLATYSEEHLEVILGLFHRMRDLSRREAARLR
jgi:hypothetical protein